MYIKAMDKRKAYAILRGFPGLGRVVSGLEIVRFLNQEYNFDVKIFTYFNGEAVAKSMGFDVENYGEIGNESLTDIGLLPVSQIGAKVISSILEWNPDIVIIDGEPLIVKALGMVFSSQKIINLVNPCDIYNPYTPLSNNLFFRDCNLSCGTTICHGFSLTDKTFQHFDNHLYYLNTILRKSVIGLKTKKTKCQKEHKHINCVLGGGSSNAPKTLYDSTIKIGKKVIDASYCLNEYYFDLYTNDPPLARELENYNGNGKVTIHDSYCSPDDLYIDSDLIICRSGRNTVSELIYLELPAILISAGSDFRGKEQSHNAVIAEKLSGGLISCISIDEYVEKLVDLIQDKLQFKIKVQNNFIPGNEQLYAILRELINKND